jgi:hypothetical protein
VERALSGDEDKDPGSRVKVVGYDVAGYDGFRERARDQALTLNEKCGFPEDMRGGRSESISQDIRSKLSALNHQGARILDIGAGCSELTCYIIDACANAGASVTVIDSPEMLALLPDQYSLTKIAGRFPECLSKLSRPIGLFAEGNLFGFIDAAMRLLDQEARLLIGDIPNVAMRNRFLASPSGELYHRQHYSNSPLPVTALNSLDEGQIDDRVVLGILARARAAGMHAFVVPQASGLPMANRREDILIGRP